MNILFVCTGNTCRSPMAEGLFAQFLKQNDIEKIEVKSAGVSAMPGDPPSENAVLAAKELGADISAHRSTRLTDYLADWADVVVCMTAVHARLLMEAYPDKKIQVLGGGIIDPYGGDLKIYRECARNINECFAELYESLKSGEEKA